MKLMIVSIDHDGIVRVSCEGPITTTDIKSDGKNPLETVLGQNWAGTRILLSMEQTDYIDSSAVGWLIGTQKSVREKGGGLVLYNVHPGVQKVFDLLKVGRVVPVATDEAAGRKLLLEGGAK